MKVIGLIVLLLVAASAFVVIAGQAGMLSGKPPGDLGVHSGRLLPPKDTPNSVSSQSDLYPDHPQRPYASIAPLPFQGNPEAALQKLGQILKTTARTEIILQQPDYIYAQCTTPLLKFTDDVEFWLDRSAGLIHVRSASRLGRSDFGVNRARIEKIRAQFLTN